MTELEKFKRRMIRIVARLHLKEKKPEQELWEDLKKETKCDCKWLWERMRTLTLKRLKRLIIADDRHDCITNIARMSLTDWLLYDLILVHEKIDVIGAELMLMGEKKVEPRPLFELFSLVQRFEVEGLVGEGLAAAWTAATFFYNNGGRQCSPMLLQRRWYQMKEATRNVFYKFWYTYRGNLKLLHVAMNESPTRLQMAIAKRYPHIITRTFLSWEDMIEKRMVILPDEFQTEMKKHSQSLPKPSETDPDLVLLEPEIETIDLRVDSDSDNELKEQVESEESANISETETANALAGIGATPKLEPGDLSIDDDFGDIGALENIEIPVETTSVAIDDDQEICAENNERITDSINPKIIQDNEPELSKASDYLTESAEPEIVQKEYDIKPETKDRETDEEIETIDDSTDEHFQESLVVPQITNVFGNVHIEDEALAKLSKILDKKVATPISLNVPALCETSNRSMQYQTPQTQIYSCDDDDEEIEDDIIKTEIIDENYIELKSSSKVTSEQVSKLSVVNKDKDETVKLDKITIKIPEKHVNLFEDVANNLTFDDEGIELEDDGIVVDNDEHSFERTKSQDDTSSLLQSQQSVYEKEEEGEEEVAKFDLKLLMDPVVYTKKIDEMSIFKNSAVYNVRSIEDINRIFAESKPVSKMKINDIQEEKREASCSDEKEENKIIDNLFGNINIKKEDLVSSCNSEDDHSKFDDDLFDNVSDSEYIPESKKVKLTSNLLQKPRNRNYNPITLCKNPDFNTRLKRLTVGFLSSTRNRRLLKACKPLTIDVSKSFESKIIDNTLYLKSCTNEEQMNEENKIDDKFNENQHTTSVVPSAMPAQSLIDIMKTNMEELISKRCQLVHAIQKPLEENSVLGERNKVINLPHIDNVRRINQKLLVAEVSPIQVNPAEVCIPPVQLIPRQEVVNGSILKDPSSNIHSTVSESVEKETDISSGKVICSGTVIRGNNHQFITHAGNFTTNTSKGPDNLCKRTNLERMFDKYRQKASQQQLNRKRQEPLDWTFGKSKSISQTLQNYTDEYLLTIDTLNKMLNLMDESKDNPVKTMILHEKAKKFSKSKVVMRRQIELQQKLSEYERRIKGEINQPPATNISTVQSLTTPNEKKKRGRRVYKSAKDKTISSCEKESKDTETEESMKKACESIESVVQKTRELIDNKAKSSLNVKTTVKTVDASTSTSNANTTENTSDTIEVTDTCTVINNTQVDSSNTQISIEVQDSVNSMEQTSITLENDTNISEKSSTSIVHVDTATGNLIPTSETTSNSISVDISPSQVSSVISSDIIEIDDSPLCVASDAHNTLSPSNVISLDHSKRANDPIPTITTIDRDRPPKIKTKITSSQKNTRQRSAVSGLSRGRKYQYLPCVKNSDVNNERVLFLSSKSLSKEPNTQPIFLGRNKILLTDVQLPRIQHMNPSGIVISQYIDQSKVSLPKGVDFVLLPNGELTCTIAPDTHLDFEQLALIPKLLARLRQQMGGGTTLVPPLVPTKSVVPNVALAENISEVVNISDDENIPINSADGQLAADKVSNENVVTTPSKITQLPSSSPIVQSTNEQGSSDPNENNSEKNCIPENIDTVKGNSEDLSKETKKNYKNNIESSTLEHNINISEVPKNNSDINTATDSVDSNKSMNVDTIIPTFDIKENNEKAPNDVSTASVKKTILSDLMEMSGIFEDDISPTVEVGEVSTDVITTQPTWTPSLVVGTDQDASGSKVVTPSLVTDASQITFGNTVINLPELNPITSFAELKYAFEKSGNFFKLDLTTRVLAPINVCIKKNEKANKNDPDMKQKILTVDLTDENDESITIDTKTVSETQRSEAFSVTENKSTPDKTQDSCSIKPLKLFKVTRPNILRGFKKKGTNVESQLVSILKRHSLRKIKQSSQDVKNNSNRKPVQSEHYDINIVENSDDSSDDEPLAKKAQRKKESTEVSGLNIVDDVEPVSENVTSDNDRKVQTEGSLSIEHMVQAEESSPIDCLEHVEGHLPNQEEDLANSSVSSLPTELSFISDHDNNGSDEELCILGV